MRQEYMVKQYVGKVKNNLGYYFMVFTTGNPKYLLFCPMDKTGQFMGTIQFPVLKKDLNRNWKKYMVV